MMSFDWFLPKLALALVIGMMIGVERGWRMRDEKAGARVAGVRTFSLLGLLGGIAGLFVIAPLGWLMLLLIAAAVLMIALGSWADMKRDGNVSITSAVAAMLTLAFGAMAGAGYSGVASVSAGVTVLLLASREPLHRMLAGTSDVELRALVRLVLVVSVVYPLLPDAAIGPFGINPRRIWTIVAVIGSVSFFGYGLMRMIGTRKGLMVTALVGSLVSSTAVTLECARRMRAHESVRANQAAIAVASLVMLMRATVLVAALLPTILVRFSTLMLPALIIAGLISALLFVRGTSDHSSHISDKIKPPGLAMALGWGCLVLLMAIIAGWAEHQIKGTGAAVIAIGGLFDVDSAIAAIGTLPAGTLTPQLTAYAVAAPVVFNSILKAGITLAIAGVRNSLAPIAALVLPAAAIAGAVIFEVI